MYEAVTGRPMPRIRLAITTSTSASKRLPWLSAIIMALNFSPSPVSPTTPTMIPATAQATETVTALRAPSSSAAKDFCQPATSSAPNAAPLAPAAAQPHSARPAAAATTAMVA